MEITYTFTTLILLITHRAIGDECTIKVEQGILAGQLLDLVTGDGKYCSFKGIPYAKPPIGDLRFKAPIAAPIWQGVRNATRHGPVCPQKDAITEEYTPGNENCLFLNVYSPNLNPTTLSAVLFYIHGGGFKSGSGDVSSFGPDFLLRKDLNIVLVTINYRLDVLGFLSVGNDGAPGNAGMKDQVMALKWVQSNIKYFGGDPNKVTIMGQSAGSVSCALHMVSPMSAGLFHRVIALSGSPYNDWNSAYKPEQRAFKLGRQVGFETRDAEALVSFLQKVSSKRLVKYKKPNVLASEEISVATKQFQFTPVVEKNCGDKSFLTENLFNRKFTHVNKADLLFGHTSEEGVTVSQNIINYYLARYNSFIELFAPRKVAEQFGPDVVLNVSAKVRDYYMGNKSVNVKAMKEFVKYISEAHFVYDVVRYYSQFPNRGSKYMYQFSALSKRNAYGNMGAQYGIFGAGHIDDLYYLFDPKSLNLPLAPGSIEIEIVKRFTEIIKNFVHYGNPTPNSSFGVAWPEFDNKNKYYMDIGTYNLTLLSVNDKPYFKFWLELLESVGVKY